MSNVFRHLGANIFALDARATRHGAFVSVYLGLPPELDLAAARDIVQRSFRCRGPRAPAIPSGTGQRRVERRV